MANPLARIKGINGQIVALDADIEQVADELAMLRHIDDDAKRDAAVSGNYDDRVAAKMTHADVVRIEKQIVNMERTRARLVAKRDRLVRILAAQ